MTELDELLAARIERAGPIGFDEFMSQALYHPTLGYYRRARDPFGIHGDFYTAEQIQPVFGILIGQRIRQLANALGDPDDFTVLELGPGRLEMASAFARWRYLPVEVDGEMPPSVRGVVFSNEFFDALPVRVARYSQGRFREQCVTFQDGRFRWIGWDAVAEDTEQYLRAFYPPPEEGRWYEMSLVGEWMEKISRTLVEGWVLTIDYGFTREESIRFPRGTLMSYHRHIAIDDVLADPGEHDITSHVNFTALIDSGMRAGFAAQSFETLASTLLAAGEPDQFAEALGRGDELRRRMQLKTLLFGMGESFRVLLQRRVGNRSEKPEK